MLYNVIQNSEQKTTKCSTKSTIRMCENFCKQIRFATTSRIKHLLFKYGFRVIVLFKRHLTNKRHEFQPNVRLLQKEQ